MGHVLLYIKLVFPCFLPCFGVVCVSEILETSGSNSLQLLPCSHPRDTNGVLRAAPLAVNVWPVNSYQRYYFLLLQQPLKVEPTSEDHHDAYKKAEAQKHVGNTKGEPPLNTRIDRSLTESIRLDPVRFTFLSRINGHSPIGHQSRATGQSRSVDTISLPGNSSLAAPNALSLGEVQQGQHTRSHAVCERERKRAERTGYWPC
ncbi:hypothetical protein GWK47_038593 [Chionoecetes opilio]|uniref:Secreted protein n=1 Tax=Chionoecetes opilio TaxID=41210 RepID=A0A8J4YCG5_CHIOP|nr:hypothetical protein GWK47_038593 [Chionoecetes opilio]